MDITILGFSLQVGIIPPGDFATGLQMLYRWLHLVSGFVWLGFLYYFNLVSSRTLPRLDPAMRATYLADVLPRAAWWFRWSSVVTMLAGISYWMAILGTEPVDAPGSMTGKVAALWTVTCVVAFGLQFIVIKRIRNAAASGAIIAVIIATMAYLLAHHLLFYPGASNRALCIGVGGAFGMIMWLNVWGIVWRVQKKFIAWGRENRNGSAQMPADLMELHRQAWMASKVGFWLSFPLLFFMGAASHYPLFVH